MAERSPLFLGLVRPPKLFGLPIMYAVVWLFGTVLLFCLDTELPRAWHCGGSVSGPLEGGGLGPPVHRLSDDGSSRDTPYQKQENSWRRQLCPVTRWMNAH